MCPDDSARVIREGLEGMRAILDARGITATVPIVELPYSWDVLIINTDYFNYSGLIWMFARHVRQILIG